MLQKYPVVTGISIKVSLNYAYVIFVDLKFFMDRQFYCEWQILLVQPYF